MIRALDRVLYRIAVRLWQVDNEFTETVNPGALHTHYTKLAMAAYKELVKIDEDYTKGEEK